MNIKAIGIDLAKNIFHIHAINSKGKQVFQKKVSRKRLPEVIANIPSCEIYMEACTGANYWLRKFENYGHTVRLVSPQFVKPYVKTNKNDYADAAAIVEAGTRAHMHFVPPKTIEQQDIQSVHTVRESFMCKRNAIANQIRGLLAERGLIIPAGISYIKSEVPDMIEDAENELSMSIREILFDLYQEFFHLDRKVKDYDQKLKKLFDQHEACQTIAKVGGIGFITATAIYAVMGKDTSHFKRGRHFSAYLGLVSKHTGTGGKNKLMGISKRGNSYLRKLLIQGAKSVVRYADKKQDKYSRWVSSITKRKGPNVAAVAVANKNARVIWAMLHYNTEYQNAA